MDAPARQRLGSDARVQMTARFPVLMYHRLEAPDCPVVDSVERPWAIPVADFEMQMKRLHDGGRTGVSMHEIHGTLAAGKAVPPAWVGITFDDGNASDYQHAMPILAQYGFRATFFICGERLTGEMPPAQVRALHAAGMHIGSHAMTHRFMTTLDAASEEDEVVRSRKTLEGIIGEQVVHFAPPGGRWSQRTRRLLEGAGYVAVSSSRYGFNRADKASFSYCRLPIVRATSMYTFDAMVHADRMKLWGGYARAGILGTARFLMGESVYGHARAWKRG
jgi:peptidoglycan/xylan/chitin deacetylase (PgdA/CDA1 family)